MINLDHELEYELSIESQIDSCVSILSDCLCDVYVTYPTFEDYHFSSANEYEKLPFDNGDSSTHLLEHDLP